RQCHLNFMPFASSLHATVAFCRATFSASDSFAASAGIGTNAMPLSTAAIMPAIKAVAKWFMIPSLEPLIFTSRPSHHIRDGEGHRLSCPALSFSYLSLRGLRFFLLLSLSTTRGDKESPGGAGASSA